MSYKWKFNEVLALDTYPTGARFNCSFNSGGLTCVMIIVNSPYLSYLTDSTAILAYTEYEGWNDETHRLVELTDEPTGELLTFLQHNAMQLPSSTINKVDLNGVTVLDLTADTVTEQSLLLGTTAHNAKGELITGTLVPCVVYSTENPETITTNVTGYFTWEITAEEHGFQSDKLIVACYLSTGEQIQCDVSISSTYTVTIGVIYNSSIALAAGDITIPSGYMRAVIMGPVETPEAIAQAMLNNLAVYEGGG